MFQKMWSYLIWSLKRKTILLYLWPWQSQRETDPSCSPQSAPAWECWRTGVTRWFRPSWAATSPCPATTTWRRRRRFSTASSGTGLTRRANMEIIIYILYLFLLVHSTELDSVLVKMNYFYLDPSCHRSSTDIYPEVKIPSSKLGWLISLMVPNSQAHNP